MTLPSTFKQEVTAKAPRVSEEKFVAVLDLIADSLFSVPGGAGAKFSADPQSRTISFGFRVEASSGTEAHQTAEAIAISAIREASVRKSRGTETPVYATTQMIREFQLA